MKYFKGSIVFTVVCLALAAGVGFYYDGTIGASLATLFAAALLAILEVSVSLDNAVVNATVLKDMNPFWRNMFLTVGMIVAVFGMRLVFPLLIVSVAGGVNPWTAVNIALFQPKQYEAIITSVHMQVMAFGGMFLFLVFAKHFIDHEKEEHWIPFIGPVLAKIGKHSTAYLAIPTLCVLAFSHFVENQQAFLMSAMAGLVAYMLVDGLEDVFEVEDAAEKVARAGLASFLYLEVLDASFSFDGVIAAFAITNNFLIIMLGLGIGAMFVRSLTIMLVEMDTLATLRYLEDGAFWGIGWLVITMFLSIKHIELGEVAVAGGAALFIALAGYHSVVANKRDKKNGVTEAVE